MNKTKERLHNPLDSAHYTESMLDLHKTSSSNELARIDSETFLSDRKVAVATLISEKELLDNCGSSGNAGILCKPSKLWVEPVYYNIDPLEWMNKLYGTSICEKRVFSRLERLNETVNGNEIFIKREAENSSIGSFKNRGAWNALGLYYSNSKSRLKTVIAPSAGNHAQGVLDAVITFRDLEYSLFVPPEIHLFIPSTTAPSKVEALKAKADSSGLVVKIFDQATTFDEAEQLAKKATSSEPSSLLIHPFNDPEVIEGQGTLATEIFSQLTEYGKDLGNVRIFIPIGGGGLASGFVQALESLPPNKRPKLVGVQLTGADSAYRTWVKFKQERVIEPVWVNNLNRLADGTMVRSLGENTAQYIVKLDDIVVVNNQEVGEQYFKATNGKGWQSGQLLAEPASMIGQTGCYIYDQLCKSRGSKVPTNETWVTINTGIHANPVYVNEFISHYTKMLSEQSARLGQLALRPK